MSTNRMMWGDQIVGAVLFVAGIVLAVVRQT